MKFRVTMKDPDGVYECLEEAAEASVAELSSDEDERKALLQFRREKITKQCAKWFDYGEYVTLEIDTEADTCVVVPH